MKPLLTLLFLTLWFSGYTQNDWSDDALAESEMKSAEHLLQFRANANTGNYDLRYHRLELDIDPDVNFISGDVTSYFVAKENLSQLVFDLDDNLTVSQVTRDGQPLGFTQNTEDELVITLPATITQGTLDSLTVSYSGAPVSSGFGSFEQTTHNSDPIIWTLSEPYGAKTWWPCKQDLIDKVDSLDVILNTPQFNLSNEEYIAVSNGVEQSQVINGSTKTTHFKHRFPIPAYLIAIAVTNYDVFTQEVPNAGNPFDIVNYVFPESMTDAQQGTPVTLDIMDLFIDLFEPYPYAEEKYGHAEFTRSGGMEHTTISFMGNYSRNLIAHELAHQWFGNKITCGSWKDIWLNEGFATYLSGLVVEALDSNADFADWKMFRVDQITSEPDGQVYLTDQDTTSVSRIFNGRLSYSKGAMVLHMLRKKLGDADFYQGVRDYLVHPDLAFSYAKTEDFIPIMEQASGKDLTEFFNDWIYDEGFPSFSVSWEMLSPGQLGVMLSQSQSHPSVSFFEIGVPLRLQGSAGETMDVVLDHSTNNEEFVLNVPFTVSSIEFDPEHDIISANNTVTLGLDDFVISRDIKLIPNPARSSVEIIKPENLAIEKVQIFDLQGRLIREDNSDRMLSVEKLSAGWHLVRLVTSEGPVTKTLIKH